ncbi:MAG: penicillin-insensitive murein endopeptidase [Solirubrobacterales bacterium]|nr:penicillin-insensitive murein endopeptidase [Solirubrobacterales bacterium]
MTLRRLLGGLVAVLVLGAFTAAVASAVRSSIDGEDTPPVLAGPTGPAVGALPVAPRVAAPPILAAPVPAARRVRPKKPPVVRVPAPVRPSRALGRPNRGRLADGVLFPAEGSDVTTWDAVLQATPNRDWRRVGTDRLVRTILTVAADYRRAHPGAPRVVVSDLSLPQGGRFGPEYGGLGHASHQNGLDVDIAYPRRDRREIGIGRVGEINRPLAQALVDAFVAAGAEFVFVGPRTGLRGPSNVQALENHDGHMHVRLPNVR